MLDGFRAYSIEDRCEALEELFLERTKALHYYREKVDELQLKIDDVERDCGRKIREVRKFWKDQVYNGLSRPGQILKAALQYKK